MEVRVRQPLVVLRLHVAETLLVLQKRHRPHPVPLPDVILQLRDLVLVLLHRNTHVHSRLLFLLCLRQRTTRSVHYLNIIRFEFYFIYYI